MQNWKLHLRIIVNFILCVGVFLLVIFVLPKLLRFFIPFVVAFIIAVIANPLVKFIEKKIKIGRRKTTTIIIIIVIIDILALIYLAAYIIYREVVSLIADYPSMQRDINEFVNNFSVRFAKYISMLPDNIQNFFTNLNSGTGSIVEQFFNGINLPTISDAQSLAKSVGNGLFMIIVTIIASYFFIADRDWFAETAERIFPESVKNGYKLIMKNIKNAVGGYIKAQFKLMIVIMAILYVGFKIVGVSYSLLLALLVSFLDFLPIFGTGTVLWPWIAIDLINGTYRNALVLTLLYVVCLIVKQFLQPKVVGDSIGISAFSTLLFLFIGYRIDGILGMILGIPIGMVVVALYKAGLFDRLIRGFKIIFNDINTYRKF